MDSARHLKKKLFYDTDIDVRRNNYVEPKKIWIKTFFDNNLIFFYLRKAGKTSV